VKPNSLSPKQKCAFLPFCLDYKTHPDRFEKIKERKTKSKNGKKPKTRGSRENEKFGSPTVKNGWHIRCNLPYANK
jgi:hypothetical protein